jgi:hypothetical protein
MPRLEEDKTVWRYQIQDSSKFDRFKVNPVGSSGVKVTVGRVKGTDRHEIANYIFPKQQFRAREQVRSWLDEHLKGQIQTLLDFKAWDEWRRRAVNAYVRISNVE